MNRVVFSNVCAAADSPAQPMVGMNSLLPQHEHRPLIAPSIRVLPETPCPPSQAGTPVPPSNAKSPFTQVSRKRCS